MRDNRELAATKIRVGGIIAFSDERFQPEPVLIRIVSTKQNINVLDDIAIEMSDERWKKTPRYVTFDKEGRLTLTPVKKTASYQQQTAATRQNKRLKKRLEKAEINIKGLMKTEA